MRKSKIMLGTGLGALAVTGVAIASQADTDIADKVVKDTVVDFAVSKNDVIKAKAAWTNPTAKYVYPGYEYYIVTPADESAGRSLNYFANKLGVSVNTLRYLNDIKNGERVTNSYGNPYAGSLLFYKSPYPSDRAHYYNLSQKAPKNITASNWRSKKSLNTESSNQKYPSGKYLSYSLFENEISLNASNQLVLKGWAAQTNYTDTTGTNNQTAIVVTEEGKTSAVSVNKATNTNVNPTNQFIYNKVSETNVAKRCPASDAYLDREIAFTNVGGWASTSLGGCWHNYANAGFESKINVGDLFDGNNYNKVYDLYIAQSTGANPDRLLYKNLSSRTVVKKAYANSRLSGTVTFEGKNPLIVDGKTTIDVIDGDLVMYKSLTSSDANSVNGSVVFKKGKYKVMRAQKHPTNATMYYQLEGYGATAGYRGWTSSVFMSDSGANAQLKFTVDKWEKFKLHFVSGDPDDKGTVLQTPKEYQLFANSTLGATSVSIKKTNFNKIQKGNIVWRLQTEAVNPNNKDYTVRFSATTPPKDITYTYSKKYEVQVNYINANTGAIIKSEKKEIPHGQTMNFKYSDLGVVNTDNSLLTYNGKKYKFSGDGKTTVGGAITNIMDYKSDFTKVGLDKYNTDLNKYGNSANQTRTYNETTLAQGIDNVNFYYYEPQTYTTNHVRLDSNENWVKADGSTTKVIGEATVSKDSGTYYTGQSIKVQAYGVNRAENEQLFGDYKFAGKGKYEKSTKIYNALSLTGSNKFENVSKGQETLKLGLTKLNAEEYGNSANLYYRRAIKDPSGNCELGVDCETSTNPSNPGNPNGTGESGNQEDYVPTLTGQYNWYLTKEKDVKSDNWSQSKLALSNTGRVGNNKVYAVVNFKNTIALNNEGKYNYQTKYAGQETDIYYSDLVTKRNVQKTVGEGVTVSKQEMNITKTKGNTDYEKASVAYIGKDYTALNAKLPLNSKLYKAGNVESNYEAKVEQEAGKTSKVIYETNYEYTNTFRDNYKKGESYGNATFTWDYEYTNPVFTDDLEFDYTGITDVDHKLNEDITTSLSKKDDKVKSKVGILKDFKSTNVNGKREEFKESTANALGLYETVEKTKTIDAKLKTQSKVEAQEDIKYTNDVLNGKLDTFGADKESFVGYKDSFNKFTYNNKNGFNQYLVKDVDFNYRDVDTVSSIKNNLMKKQVTDKTKLEDSVNYQYQMGLKVENTESAMDSNHTQTVRVNLANKYGVLSDSGLLVENNTNAKLENQTEIAKQYKNATGYDISSSDKLLKQADYKSYYYVPFDGKSTLKNNEKYTNRNVLSNIGLSDINIAVDNSFQFDDYLVGSTEDDTVYTSYKAGLTKNGKYTKGQVIVTSKEKDAIKDSEELKSDDTKNFRTLNVKSMMDSLHKFIGFKN